jgi:geranylgeranyl diphosphate synthase type II
MWQDLMMITNGKTDKKALKNYLGEKRIAVEKRLSGLLDRRTCSGRLSDAMEYSVTAGGKRLRPILCIAAGETLSAKSQDGAMIAGCAIEFIHTYSLIHDDLPAMDDDALRRGKPTCHMAFDEATAILSGDALLTLSFEVLTKDLPRATGDHEKALEVTGVIAKAAGGMGMVEGQMRDILAEGKTLSLEDLESLHRLKTGALINASVECGAILAGASEKQRDHLKQYARNLGLAFQVADDLLNVEGDPSLMGKAVGTDAEKMKSTYPSLLGIQASKEKAKLLVSNALQSLEIFDTKADPLRAIADYVINRDR